MITTLVVYVCLSVHNGLCVRSQSSGLASWSGPESVQECEAELITASAQIRAKAPRAMVAFRCEQIGART